MKTSLPQKTLNFLLANILAISAQSFLLIPQRQEILIKDVAPNFIILLSVFFLFISYFNLSLIFYFPSPKWEKLVFLLSLFSLALLAFLYAQVSLFVETILFAFLSLICFLSLWEKNQEKDLLRYSVIIVNIVIGIAIFFWGDFLRASLYWRVDSAKTFFSLLFLGTAAFGLISLLRPEKYLSRVFHKLIVLPWIGWAILFLRGPEISILIPSILVPVAFLTSGLRLFPKICNFYPRAALAS